MQSTEKPDYKFWSKKDTWTLKEAALLLHRLEPLNYRSLRLNNRNIPVELSPMQKTYFLLNSVLWWHKYNENSYNGIHPYIILTEAIHKELPIPSALLSAVKKRFEREQANIEMTEINSPPTAIADLPQKTTQEVVINERLSTRERRNLLKTIAILVHLLVGESEKRSPRYCRGNKLNLSQVAQTIIEKAQNLGMELEGIKSLNRKLSEALQLLDEESIPNESNR